MKVTCDARTSVYTPQNNVLVSLGVVGPPQTVLRNIIKMMIFLSLWRSLSCATGDYYFKKQTFVSAKSIILSRKISLDFVNVMIMATPIL